MIRKRVINMKEYCCRELHDLEDDSFQRGFGINVIEKNRVEIFCMDDAGYLNALTSTFLISVPSVVVVSVWLMKVPMLKPQHRMVKLLLLLRLARLSLKI